MSSQKLYIYWGTQWKGIEINKMICIDMEKVYDRVPREVLWRVLKKKGVWITYIQVIKVHVLWSRNTTKTCRGDTEAYSITIGLHQGSTLSLYLFDSLNLSRHRCVSVCYLLMALCRWMRQKKARILSSRYGL